MKKQAVATKKHVAAIAQNLLKANGSTPVPTRCCFTRICGPGSLLPILIKNGFSSRTAYSRTPPFPLRKHYCTLADCGFAAAFAAPKFAGLRYPGYFAAEGQCYGSQKYGHSEANCLQLRAAKVR
jgi:hypothetical protein